jgi:uncharacterized membrane protein
LAVIGRFGPIHLPSLFAIWSIFEAMRQIYSGNSALHRRIMHNLYWYGLMIAGLVNFLPGRVTNRVFFGCPSGKLRLRGDRARYHLPFHVACLQLP